MGEMSIMAALNASVAQLDRVLPSEGRGRGFESRRMRQIRQGLGSNPEAFFVSGPYRPLHLFFSQTCLIACAL